MASKTDCEKQMVTKTHKWCWEKLSSSKKTQKKCETQKKWTAKKTDIQTEMKRAKSIYKRIRK